MFFSKLTGYISDFVHLIYPEQCIGCNNTLYDQGPICAFCEASIPRTNSHNKDLPALSKNIQGRIHPKHLYAYMTYSRKGLSQNLLHEIKYKGNKKLGEYLGYKFSLELMERGLFLDQSYLLIPVPLHPKKQKQRGYNQAEEICKGISNAFGFHIETEGLKRLKNTSSQTTKNREERWDDLESVFDIHNQELIENKNVILVDDILTTGATFESCYNALQKGKPKSISILSLAVRL